MTEKKLKLLTEHCDFKGNLRLDVIMRLFQDVAIENITSLGYPPHYTFGRNLLWVIAQIKVEIYRLPKFEEEVIVSTHPGKRMMFIFNRHYEIKDPDGNILIKATGLWALINKETRKIADPVKEQILIESELDGSEIICPTRTLLGDLNQEVSFSPSYSQIDINGHLNNTYYLSVVEDLIPLDFIKNHDPKSFWVAYRKEIKLGEQVNIKFGLQDGSYCFDSENFQIKIDY